MNHLCERLCHLAQNTHHHCRLCVTWHRTHTTTTDCGSPGTQLTPPLQTVCHLAQNTHHCRLWVTWHTTHTPPLQTVCHLAHNTHSTATDWVLSLTWTRNDFDPKDASVVPESVMRQAGGRLARLIHVHQD